MGFISYSSIHFFSEKKTSLEIVYLRSKPLTKKQKRFGTLHQKCKVMNPFFEKLIFSIINKIERPCETYFNVTMTMSLTLN